MGSDDMVGPMPMRFFMIIGDMLVRNPTEGSVRCVIVRSRSRPYERMYRPAAVKSSTASHVRGTARPGSGALLKPMALASGPEFTKAEENFDRHA